MDSLVGGRAALNSSFLANDQDEFEASNDAMSNQSAVHPSLIANSEAQALAKYQTPSHDSSSSPTYFVPKSHYVLNPLDRSIVKDDQGRPLTVARLLGMKPLQRELSSRPGPGNRRLTYLSGEGVTRILNETFGYDGWNMTICQTKQVDLQNVNAPTNVTVSNSTTNTTAGNRPPHSGQQQQLSGQSQRPPKWHVTYMAQVRITLTHHDPPGTIFREDVGFGDSLDRQLTTAIQHALKSSVTDAMKRAARLFGDRLGNSLYDGQSTTKNAPKTLSEGLAQYDKTIREKYGSQGTKQPAKNESSHTSESTKVVNTAKTTAAASTPVPSKPLEHSRAPPSAPTTSHPLSCGVVSTIRSQPTPTTNNFSRDKNMYNVFSAEASPATHLAPALVSAPTTTKVGTTSIVPGATSTRPQPPRSVPVPNQELAQLDFPLFDDENTPRPQTSRGRSPLSNATLPLKRPIAIDNISHTITTSIPMNRYTTTMNSTSKPLSATASSVYQPTSSHVLPQGTNMVRNNMGSFVPQSHPLTTNTGTATVVSGASNSTVSAPNQSLANNKKPKTNPYC